MVDIYFEALHPAVCNAGKRPSPAVLDQPEWWNAIPHYYGEFGTSPENTFQHKEFATVRNCPAVSDAITFGYILYNQFDYFIDATNDGKILWSAPELAIDAYQFVKFPIVDSPGKDNYEGFSTPVGYHESLIKVSTLWSMRTPPGYSAWITQPLYQSTLPTMVVDGVVDSDKMPLLFPISLWVKKGFAGTIKAGTPIAQVVPFKRDDFEAHYGDFDVQEAKDIDDVAKTRFTNSYKRLSWVRKKFK